jgi:DegV family protein with EDD domain
MGCPAAGHPEEKLVAKPVLVTDSSSTIPTALLQKYDIRVAPLVLIWGNEELRDGVDIQTDEFYARLKDATVMPTTSQATIAAFKEIYAPLVAEGRPILTMVLSSKLSGTDRSALEAKAMFPGATIEIIDSQAIAMALGFQLFAAARMLEAGVPFDDVVTRARGMGRNTGVVFLVDTLEYLHRGGRIGSASRFMGTALNIKPLLALQDGKVEGLEKVRTTAKARARLLDLVEERVKGKRPLRIAALHAAAEDEAKDLLAEAVRRFSPDESYITPVSPVIGSHTGPGTVGLCFATEI